MAVSPLLRNEKPHDFWGGRAIVEGAPAPASANMGEAGKLCGRGQLVRQGLPGIAPGESCVGAGKVVESSLVSRQAAHQTSAVFVKDDTFEEPMEYPQGANRRSGACKPTT